MIVHINYPISNQVTFGLSTFSNIGGLMVNVRSFWEVVLILIAPLMGINDGKLGPIYQELWQRCEG